MHMIGGFLLVGRFWKNAHAYVICGISLGCWDQFRRRVVESTYLVEYLGGKLRHLL